METYGIAAYRRLTGVRQFHTLAGLQGDVVPVCEMSGGRMFFIAPKNYHPYFTSITLEFVFANLNRDIYVE